MEQKTETQERKRIQKIQNPPFIELEEKEIYQGVKAQRKELGLPETKCKPTTIIQHLIWLGCHVDRAQYIFKCDMCLEFKPKEQEKKKKRLKQSVKSEMENKKVK